MKIIKIISNDRKALVENIPGDFVTLPEDSDEINSFIYPNEVAEQTFYIIEISPDDNNPLNFNGVKIAMYLYFKHLQEKKLNFFIQLIGFESKADFFFDCEYSSFIKCPNVAYEQINLDFGINIPSDIIKVDTDITIDLLKKINIKPPTSYKTHHSIANEWAISRWSQYLGIKTALDKEIEKSLYFQYLKTINQILKVKEKPNFLLSGGRLMLIDDEEKKGWGSFFKKLKLSSSTLEIETIGKEFKDTKTRDEIVEKCKTKIIKFKPHTIILDLRLHDSDFDEDNPINLTGYKVLEKIKKSINPGIEKGINPGIQVILFTASNKVWNYQALNSIGFDGWITKESPELSSDPSFTQKAIKDLKTVISGCLNKKHLSNVYEEKEKLIDILEDSKYEKSFIEQIKNQLNLSFYLLLNADKKEEFAFAYVALYMIIETINNNFVSHNEDDNYWYISDEKLRCWTYNNGKYEGFYEYKNKEEQLIKVINVNVSKPPEWQKIAGLYFQYWKGKDQNFVQNIYHSIKMRNAFLHNDNDMLDYAIEDKNGNLKYLNHYIYKPKGYLKLFEIIKRLINYI